MMHHYSSLYDVYHCGINFCLAQLPSYWNNLNFADVVKFTISTIQSLTQEKEIMDKIFTHESSGEIGKYFQLHSIYIYIYIPAKDDIEKLEADRIGGTELVGEGDGDLDVFSLSGPHLELSDVIFQTEGKVQNHPVKCFNFANDLFLGAEQGNTELFELQVRLILDMILV